MPTCPCGISYTKLSKDLSDECEPATLRLIHDWGEVMNSDKPLEMLCCSLNLPTRRLLPGKAQKILFNKAHSLRGQGHDIRIDF